MKFLFLQLRKNFDLATSLFTVNLLKLNTSINKKKFIILMLHKAITKTHDICKIKIMKKFGGSHKYSRTAFSSVNPYYNLKC